MLQRTGRRLLSRQALPRPHRLYTTPSYRRNAPATATASSTASPAELPPFASSSDSPFADLSQFLQRKPSVTLLSTPRRRVKGDTLAAWCPDSAAVDMCTMVDACLHNLFDVPRAESIFQAMRKERSAALEIGLYNTFLETYLALANKEPTEADKHIGCALELYDSVIHEKEPVSPNTRTFSVMLAFWHAYQDKFDPMFVKNMLPFIAANGLDILPIVSSPLFTDPETIISIARTISLEAANQGLYKFASSLGNVQELGEDIYKDVPDVRPVLKGTEGEEVIPHNLDSLRTHLSGISQTRRSLSDLDARQRHLEAAVYDIAKEQLEHRAQLFEDKGIESGFHKGGELQSWMWNWHKKNVVKIKEEINKILEDEAKKRRDTPIGPYLTLVKPETMSLLTILEIVRNQSSLGVGGGMKMTRSLLLVGRAVELEYKTKVCKANNISPSKTMKRTEELWTKMGYDNLQQRRMIAAQSLEGEGWTATWSQIVRSKVGAVLVECLMETATVTRRKIDPETGEELTEEQPAFFSAYEYVRGQKLGILSTNPIVVERLSKDSLTRTVHPRHLPMLVPPKPWINYNSGGYIFNQSSAMRFKESVEQEMYLKQATKEGNCELVYASLDILGRQGWKINRNIFDVVIQVWNSGDRMGKIPPATFDLPEPVLNNPDSKDLEERGVYLQKLRQYNHLKANNHSERCSVNYKIEIARTFLGDTFYLPHNVDFRGRAYPIPPHLNHIGDDLSRALLLFADGKPLGERGLYWLKIHLANLYGYDKARFDERVQWVEEHLEQIFESAENPLEGSRWWLKADDPWQCLATCIELRNALQSPEPTQYECALPVHQDGTCNGLQHYAALGGDDRGAKQVNLAAADRPSDVYTHVSLAVEKLVEQDAAAGNEMAKILLGKISRKVVKQTVMTTVYGVTYVGARDQIDKQLKDRGDISAELCWDAASYLTVKVLSCIGETFTGAKHIQTWLNTCARLIAKSVSPERLRERIQTAKAKAEGKGKERSTKVDLKKEQMSSVIWTTPLGLPIVQPYRKTPRKQILTNIQSVYISDPNSIAEVNAVKQATAFPPNFIHSLDATHMMLTAIECNRRGLSFASVHDSYWTHAGDIDTMSAIIRDCFISLHSSPILDRLRDEFMERYKDHVIPLSELTAPGLIKRLEEAGTRIKATEDQLPYLKYISPIVDYSGISQPEESTPESSEDVPTTAVKKAKKVPLKPDEAADAMLSNRFVKLLDLLPALPEKGSFKVEQIKESKYFFS